GANAFAPARVAKDVFAQRDIGVDQLPAASVQLLPLDEAAEAERAKRVGEQFGTVAPGVVQYTTDVLFRDLWRRPDLAPRDRSLVTVSALIATGQAAQLPYHLNRAMDYGLTQPQAADVLTHLAFYTAGPVSSRPCQSRKMSSKSACVERRRPRNSHMRRRPDEPT